MGIREQMNENPTIVTGVTAGIIFIALVLIIIQLWPSRRADAPTGPAQQWYYTTDDGATHFADEANKVAPFDHDGRPAVVARVYQCGGKEFVGRLEKYTPEAQQKLEGVKGADPRSASVATSALAGGGLLVKAPGTGDQWVSRDTAEGAALFNPTCPDGDSMTPREIYPK